MLKELVLEGENESYDQQPIGETVIKEEVENLCDKIYDFTAATLSKKERAALRRPTVNQLVSWKLLKKEDNLKSQNVISSWDGDRFRPYVFTEQGFAMRQYLYQCGGFVNRLVQVKSKEIEQDRRLLEHDQKIDSLFDAMDHRETDLS